MKIQIESRGEQVAQSAVDYFLDITGEVCPMTFVKTKLMIERMAPGEIVEVRLNAGEPLENVPRSVSEHGHVVLSLTPETSDAPRGEATVYRLQVRKV